MVLQVRAGSLARPAVAAGGTAVRGPLGAARAGCSLKTSAWGPRSATTWPPRSTSPISRTWNSWRRAATRPAIPGAGCWPRLTWPSFRPMPSRGFRRTPPGTRCRICRRPRSTTVPSPNPVGERLRAKLSYTNIGFALAPETFTIAQLRDIYAASVGHPISATNLQRILTRRGVIEAMPAAPGRLPGGQARHPVPVRDPEPGRDQPVRRVSAARPAAGRRPSERSLTSRLTGPGHPGGPARGLVRGPGWTRRAVHKAVEHL